MEVVYRFVHFLEVNHSQYERFLVVFLEIVVRIIVFNKYLGETSIKAANPYNNKLLKKRSTENIK